MKIHFKIPYYTQWGQRLLVSGNVPELGSGDIAKALALNFYAKEDWSAEIELNHNEPFELNYKYILFNEQTGQYSEEWGDDRNLKLDSSLMDHFFCIDVWNSPASLENVFLTTPFQKVLLKEEREFQLPKPIAKPTHIFKVKAPLLSKNEVICVVGDCAALCNWSTKSPLLLSRTEGDWWTVTVDLSKAQNEVHYKYGVYDPEDKEFRYFESGADHIAPVVNSKKTIVQLSDSFVRITDHSWKGAGVSLPVFSIRTKKSLGVGDFCDIKLLVDWAEKVGLKLIQVLPLNDTVGTHTDADVLPYAAISAFALNPLFLNLQAVGKLPATHTLQKEFKSNQQKWNALDLVEFLEIINYKLQYAKELYLAKKDKFLQTKEFKKFFADNEYWLSPYAAYCVLRDQFGTSDYRKWREYALYDKAKMDEFSSPEQAHFDDIAVNYFIQYHLHVQLQDAVSYAHAHGVVLKGDIPIGVNRNSVDTWVSPELFHMHMQAGAPPDMFAVKGQNWELPTYNWEQMERT